MDAKLNNILDAGPCPERDALLRYARGLSASDEERRIEVHITGCALCADAVDGFLIADTATDLEINLHDLDKRISKASWKESPRVVTMRPFYRVAAVVALLIASVGGLYFFLNRPEDAQKIISEAVSNQNTTATEIVPSGTKPASPPAAEPKEEQLKNVAAPTIKKENSNPQAAARSNVDNDAPSSPAAPAVAQNEGLLDASADKELKTKGERDEAMNVHLRKEPASGAASENTRAQEEREVKASDQEAMATVLAKKESVVRGPVPSTTLQTSIELYRTKRYKQALAGFKTVLSNDTNNVDAIWYLANTFIQLGQQQKAVPLLNSLSVRPTLYKEKADSLLKVLR